MATYNSTYLFEKLGELILFHPNLSSVDTVINQLKLKNFERKDIKILNALVKAAFSYGSSINSVLKYSKNLKNNTVKFVRTGISDDTSLQTSLQTWQEYYTNYLTNIGSSSRRKRCNLILLSSVYLN